MSALDLSAAKALAARAIAAALADANTAEAVSYMGVNAGRGRGVEFLKHTGLEQAEGSHNS